MKQSQQRVYDILKSRYPKWTNKAQLRVLYYPDNRESYDTYMGRLLNELDHMGILDKQDPIINGKKSDWREYRLTSIEAQNSQLNQETSKWLSTGQYQANSQCSVCGSWYRIKGQCNKGCK